MSSKLSKWKRALDSEQFGCLKASKYPLKLIPYGHAFYSSVVNPARLYEFKKYHESQSNDVILSSYIKCGNHLLNKICSEIMIHSDKDNTHPLYKTGDIGRNSFPFLEHFISQYTDNDITERLQWTSETLRFWWCHTPIDLLPFKSLHKNTKIITIIRNPKDVIISGYHFINAASKLIGIGGNVAGDEPTIDDYISFFIRGIGIGGCYFDFYNKYWNSYKSQYHYIWKNINLLFVYYEDLIKDESSKKEHVKRIAMFLDKDNNLNDDDYNMIVNKIDFNEMKKELVDNPQTFELDGNLHLRSGKSGDYKNYLTDEQSWLIDETMYFKWAQYSSDITYYQELFEKFKHCNNGYHL